jgi:predicted DNA binding CopG/RHH family protein
MALIKSGKEFDKNKNHDKLAKRAGTSQQYTLRIPEHLYKAVKLKMVKENKKLQPILIEMLEQYVKI